MRHLLLDLDAPLMSFGGDMVDAYGVVRDFPAKSMLAGLFANAMGWERFDTQAHAALQERLVMGSVRVAEGARQQDYQTARLRMDDRGWRTRGGVEERKNSPSYFDDWQSFYRDGDTKVRKVITHIRYRDMDCDARVLIACRLDQADDAPDLDRLAQALDRPERPLFLGRKPFLPSRPVSLGFVDAANIPAALLAGLVSMKAPPSRRDTLRAQWPLGEPDGEAFVGTGAQEEELTDERYWPSGVHAGLRRVLHGRLDWPEAAA